MKITLKNTRKFTPKKLSNKSGANIIFTEKENGIFIENNKKILKIAIGKNKLKERNTQIFLRKIIAVSKNHKLDEIHLSFDDLLSFVDGFDNKELAELLSVSFHMADFSFNKYKSKKADKSVKNVFLYSKNTKEISKHIKKGNIIGKEINKCRELCNTPGGDMTPTVLAEEARNAVVGTNIKVQVLDEFEMQQLQMGAILGVARGSIEKPRFIILEYFGADKDEPPIVLIGKGVTYDSGGLSLKPSQGMTDMHLDMSGGGSVIYSIVIAAKLGIKKNIVGLIPAVENMPSGESYRPGDILKSMSGKTIEVMNTDAEGRVILADAITYAKRYKPDAVIDLATLTGAAIVALGQRASAIFSTDAKLANDLILSGAKAGDYLWELPLWDEYDKEMIGTFADVSNIGKSPYGGAIQGATFLKQFIKWNKKWAHIDIAPRMTATDDEFLSKGSVGAGVRAVVKFLENAS